MHELRSWYADPELQVWAQVTLVVISLAGLVLNGLVVYVVAKRRVFFTADGVFMAMIGIFDILACTFSFIVSILRLSGKLSLDTAAYCKFDLFVFSTTSFASLVLTTALSGARYLVVVRGWVLHATTCATVAVVYLIFLWIETICRGLTNPLVLMPSGLYCMPYMRQSTGTNILLEVMFVILLMPCPIIIIVSYVLVAHHLHRHLKQHAINNAYQLTKDIGQPRSLIKYMRKQYLRTHLSYFIKLMLVMTTYFLSLLPEYAMSLSTLLFGTYRTSTMDCICFLAIFCLSLINPLFVLHINDVNLPQPPS